MEHDWFPWPDSLILGQTSWLLFWRTDAFGFLGYLAVVMKHLGVSVNLASWGAPCKQINNADGYMIHQDDIVRILIDYDTLWYKDTHTVNAYFVPGWIDDFFASLFSETIAASDDSFQKLIYLWQPCVGLYSVLKYWRLSQTCHRQWHKRIFENWTWITTILEILCG